MDRRREERFDAAVRALVASGDRRAFARGAVAVVVAALLPAGVVAAACGRPGQRCERDGDCCSRRCRKEPRARAGRCLQCPGGERFCRDAGECRACCEDRHCGAGRACVRGVCRGRAAGCGAGTRPCGDGCIPEGACCDDDCTGGKTCRDGACACPGDARECLDGTCGACCADGDCGAGESCQDGACRCGDGRTRCIDGACRTCCDETCTGGKTCREGLCACPDGRFACADGRCRDCCPETCAGGRTCVAGACACPDGTTACQDGVCRACCDEQCGSGKVCRNDRCACPDGRFDCADGACRQCCANEQCGGDGTCLDGRCRCADGSRRCPGGACRECCDDDDCAKGSVCTGGTCACPPGTRVCDDRDGWCGSCCDDDECIGISQCGRPPGGDPAAPLACFCPWPFPDSACKLCCPDGDVCDATGCVCPNGQRRCADGVCRECCNDDDCGNGETCCNGTCGNWGCCPAADCQTRPLDGQGQPREECFGQLQCGDGEFCCSGRCGACCPIGRPCPGGSAFSCTIPECSEELICVERVRRDGAECGSGIGGLCLDGDCILDPGCAPVGIFCEGCCGTCGGFPVITGCQPGSLGDRCNLDGFCKQGLTCSFFRCVPDSCEITEDCAPEFTGHACVHGKCVPQRRTSGATRAAGITPAPPRRAGRKKRRARST